MVGPLQRRCVGLFKQFIGGFADFTGIACSTAAPEGHRLDQNRLRENAAKPTPSRQGRNPPTITLLISDANHYLTRHYGKGQGTFRSVS